MSTPVFADITADPRLVRRRNIRIQLAEKDLLHSRIREIESVIRSLDSELDNATNRHQATCEPIQSEITTVEHELATLLADRLLVPASFASRRRELLEMLREANNELETAAADHKTRVAVFQKEIREVQKKIAAEFGSLTEHTLKSRDYANPVLLDKHWCSQRGIQFAESRIRAAAEKIELYVAQIARERTPKYGPATTGNVDRNGNVRAAPIDSSTVATYESRLARWRLELSTAHQQMADAKAEEAGILRAILDE